MLSDATAFWIAVALSAFWASLCAVLLTIAMLALHSVVRIAASRPCRHRRTFGYTLGHDQMARRRR